LSYKGFRVADDGVAPEPVPGSPSSLTFRPVAQHKKEIYRCVLVWVLLLRCSVLSVVVRCQRRDDWASSSQIYIRYIYSILLCDTRRHDARQEGTGTPGTFRWSTTYCAASHHTGRNEYTRLVRSSRLCPW